jgi:biotin transport system substrate-specific component
MLNTPFRYKNLSSANFPNTSPVQQLIFYQLIAGLFFICSQIIIPLPFNLVPLSLQPLPLLIAAILLGKHAVYGYGLYLMEGGCGLPIFSGMQGGLTRLLGPTGGYLIGFGVAMVFLTLVKKKAGQTMTGSFVALMLAGCIYFSCGLAQLAFFVPNNALLASGLYPFIIGDFCKLIIAMVFLKKHSKI